MIYSLTSFTSHGFVGSSQNEQSSVAVIEIIVNHRETSMRGRDTAALKSITLDLKLNIHDEITTIVLHCTSTIFEFQASDISRALAHPVGLT